MSRLALVTCAALLVLIPGCIQGMDLTPAGELPGAVADLRAREALPFVLDDEFSRPLVNGTLAILDPGSVFVDLTLPLSELGSAPDGSAKVHLGLWLPDVPAGTKVPVIADVGPYYADGDTPAVVPAERLGRFLIENFVPHGYAVAQVSVVGTGESTHCMDLGGPAEQAGIDAAVTWLAEQDWSNGNVAIIGRSYDGTTPWEAAAFGNPGLKTIVPISGLIGFHDLMWRNGSAETRGPIMHNGVYGRFGIDTDPSKGNVDPGDRYTLCKGYLEGPANGGLALATGAPLTPYWQQRSYLPRVLENYEGSAYFIHGLQDWNVDPHMIAPAYQQLEGAGIEVKGLFGQWAHMYPDRASEHENLREGRGKEAYPASVRLDWAQDLLEWFEHYLKGTGAKPSLHVEVQDNVGGWRVEPTFPPLDASWTETKLAEMKKLHASPDIVITAGAGQAGGGNTLGYEIAPLSDERDARVSGLPQLHLRVTPMGAGGQVYALLKDAESGMHLGHAIMDLRYHAGGTAMKQVVPGQPIVAMMEFEPLDVVIPAGASLILEIRSTGEDYAPSVVTAPVAIDLAGSVLRMPTIERDEAAFFTPPGPTGDPKGDTPGF